MIQLGAIGAPDVTAIAATAGGFIWHYLDLVDESGSGVVLIWALGLPFLPGVAAGERRGDRPVPADEPALAMSVYREGVPIHYLLQRLPPGRVVWDEVGDRWRLGENRITLTEGSDGELELRARLDLEVPGSERRVVGDITLQGPACDLRRRRVGLDRGQHAWAPRLTPGTGRVHLRHGDEALLDLYGRGYLDGNASAEPLWDLGIRRWTWLRVALPDREVVIYSLRPVGEGADRALRVDIDRGGRASVQEGVRVEVEARSRSIWGPWRPQRLRVHGSGPPLEVQATKVVDDGPFYQRFLIEGSCAGWRGPGVGEVVLPGRIDTPWLRPLVRMRVAGDPGGDSFWLPLFSGPRKGRLRRLLRLPEGAPAASPRGASPRPAAARTTGTTAGTGGT